MIAVGWEAERSGWSETRGLESYQTRGACGRVRGVWMAFCLVTRDDIAFRLGVVSWP